MARVTAAETRPCSSVGVTRCARLTTARNTHGSANPSTTVPAIAHPSTPVARSPLPAAKSAMPKTASHPSPARRRIRLLARLATTDPPPRHALNTPRNAGGSPVACTRLYCAATSTPDTAITTAPAPSTAASAVVRRMCAYPASTSARQLVLSGCVGASSGTRNRAVATAATANVAASASATTPPPARANSPAPASGRDQRAALLDAQPPAVDPLPQIPREHLGEQRVLRRAAEHELRPIP